MLQAATKPQRPRSAQPLQSSRSSAALEGAHRLLGAEAPSSPQPSSVLIADESGTRLLLVDVPTPVALVSSKPTRPASAPSHSSRGAGPPFTLACEDKCDPAAVAKHLEAMVPSRYSAAKLLCLDGAGTATACAPAENPSGGNAGSARGGGGGSARSATGGACDGTGGSCGGGGTAAECVEGRRSCGVAARSPVGHRPQRLLVGSASQARRERYGRAAVGTGGSERS